MSELRGHLHLEAARRDQGRTVLTRQAFRAPFHVSKPYWDPDAGALLVQVVNPTAGILAGDHLEASVRVGAGAALVVTTPSASRVFRMRSGTAESAQTYAVAESGWLSVCPEALVPHAGSRFRQHTRIELSPGAGLFFVDQLMPGRVGAGEAWAWSELELDLDLLVGGALVLRERFAPSAAELRDAAEFYGTGVASCFANLLVVPPAPDAGAPGFADIEPQLRALHGEAARVGVSALRSAGYGIKVVAANPLALRDTLAAVRRELAPLCPALRGAGVRWT